MKRKIYDQLVNWKQDGAGKTALLIDGARRVGKSYVAEEFAKAEYKSYLLIDFNRVGDEVKDLFLHYLNDLDTLFMYLSGYYNVKLYEHESLIIFDEVQMFPRARAAIKYLVADGRYDYLETGSLMSIRKNVKDIVIPSEEESLELEPLDFEEFLWGMDEKGLAKFCVGLGTNTRRLRAIFDRLEDAHFTDSDDVALEYVNLLPDQQIAALQTSDPKLIAQLVRLLEAGYTTGQENRAIQRLRAVQAVA